MLCGLAYLMVYTNLAALWVWIALRLVYERWAAWPALPYTTCFWILMGLAGVAWLLGFAWHVSIVQDPDAPGCTK
jgi:hypothetical protein